MMIALPDNIWTSSVLGWVTSFFNATTAEAKGDELIGDEFGAGRVIIRSSVQLLPKQQVVS